MNKRHILLTSNTYEQLFSEAGHVLSDRRQSVLSETFESQMCLHMTCNSFNSFNALEVL